MNRRNQRVAPFAARWLVNFRIPAAQTAAAAVPLINSQPKDENDLRSGGITAGDLVCRFKTYTMNQYIKGVRRQNWPRFDGKLWHRNYHEHIIRDEAELERIRQYIRDNPAKWNDDELNLGHGW